MSFIKKPQEAFQPYIDPYSKILAEKTKYLNPNKKFFQTTKHEIENFNFMPTINKVSSALNKKVSNIVFSDINKGIQNNKEMKECSFKPNINDRKVSPYTTEEIKLMIEERKKKKMIETERLRQNEEFEMLKECVFNPKINQDYKTKKKLLQTNLQLVHGFEKHVDNLEKARKIYKI